MPVLVVLDQLAGSVAASAVSALVGSVLVINETVHPVGGPARAVDPPGDYPQAMVAGELASDDSFLPLGVIGWCSVVVSGLAPRCPARGNGRPLIRFRSVRPHREPGSAAEDVTFAAKLGFV